jgi:hypothetical protein
LFNSAVLLLLLLLCRFLCSWLVVVGVRLSEAQSRAALLEMKDTKAEGGAGGLWRAGDSPRAAAALLSGDGLDKAKLEDTATFRQFYAW